MYPNCDWRRTHAAAEPITIAARTDKSLARQAAPAGVAADANLGSRREFAAEAHRQSLAIAQSEQAHHDQDFIDAISDFAAGDCGKV